MMREVRRAMTGHTRLAALVLGCFALAGTLGILTWIPPGSALLLFAPAALLFPGLALGSTLLGRALEGHNLIEKLAIWSLMGLAVLVLVGFIGTGLKANLNLLMAILAVVYAGLLVLVVVQPRGDSPGMGPGTGTGSGTKPGRLTAGKIGIILLLAAAIALTAATVIGPRDPDDWYYLAYIGDYVRGQAVNSTDALLGPAWPAPARAYYGSWWVGEALICKASGLNPISCHQVYLPLIMFPFAIFACFAVAKQLFRSEGAAYLACFLQVLFYLSSVYPSDSAGWALFVRTVQDKSLAFLFPASVATALALKLLRGPGRLKQPDWRATYFLYSLSVLTAGLVHPMGVVWCAVAVVPFAAVQVAVDRRRDRMTLSLLGMLLVPLLVTTLVLTPGREAASLLEQPVLAAREGKGSEVLFEPFLPGGRTPFKSGDRILAVGKSLWMGHPVLVTRYPLALLGLLLTVPLVLWIRKSMTARFLAVLTLAVLLFAFTPGVAQLTSAVVTKKMLYRLSWLFPWGFTIAFFLTRKRPGLRWGWVIALVLVLALCKGNPANYMSILKRSSDVGRATPEFVDAVSVLSQEAAPRGVVLASANIGLMIPAFVDQAYPAFVSPAYSTVRRSDAIRTNQDMRELLQVSSLDDETREIFREFDTQYILVESNRPLNMALMPQNSGFDEIYSNRVFKLWKVRVEARPFNRAGSAGEVTSLLAQGPLAIAPSP
jgi:hypothetical protein